MGRRFRNRLHCPPTSGPGAPWGEATASRVPREAPAGAEAGEARQGPFPTASLPRPRTPREDTASRVSGGGEGHSHRVGVGLPPPRHAPAPERGGAAPGAGTRQGCPEFAAPGAGPWGPGEGARCSRDASPLPLPRSHPEASPLSPSARETPLLHTPAPLAVTAIPRGRQPLPIQKGSLSL